MAGRRVGTLQSKQFSLERVWSEISLFFLNNKKYKEMVAVSTFTSKIRSSTSKKAIKSQDPIRKFLFYYK